MSNIATQHFWRASLLPQLLITTVVAIALFGCDPTPNRVHPTKDLATNHSGKAAASANSLQATAKTLPPKPSNPPGIHNLQKVSDRIYSGSEPEGEAGFQSLQGLGIKTIVSVDGAKPQLELAHKHHLRYVHIPIGYDGVPNDAGAALARLIRDAEPPIYIHCHHGQHRGPAAAAIACIAAGSIDNKQAIRVLERSGTSKNYAGLWRDVEKYSPPSTDAELPQLVETAQVDSLTAAMSQVDRAYDNLKLCRDARWSAPSVHPDLVPAQEAILLQEGLHEAARNLDNHQKQFDETFKTWLTDAESLATGLQASLAAKNATAADRQLISLEQACKKCHTNYRDK